VNSVIKRVSFLAAFPPIQSAIKITGDGNGMRIQFDIPETQMAEAVKLLAWRRRVVRVTVELGQETPVSIREGAG
jgi:hypothetical protein